MKELDNLQLPDDLRYAESHEWVKDTGGTIRAGLSDYAQDQLGEVVFVEMPETGTVLSQGDEMGSVESVKAVSEIYAPVSGEVIAVNDALTDAPELVNESCYDKGWILEFKPSDSAEIEKLMDRDAYIAMLKG